jgi:predicted transcriptional regulator of viral defense system
MMLDEPRNLSDYLTHLLSRGQVVFIDRDAQKALSIGKRSLLDAAERLQRRGRLMSPRRGFYVIVPPQFLSWGAPPPSWYIDALMHHEDAPYYVGLLKAAEFHGASHQAVIEFQVVTSKRLPRIRAGRSPVAFYYRKDMEAVQAGLADHKTDTGSMKISGPELTALDLVRYPRAAGGLDHIVTVLTDLGEQIGIATLANLAPHFERAALQRLGYLLCLAGHSTKAEALVEPISPRSPLRPSLPWVELDPPLAADSDFAPQPIARDERWHVIVRRIPQAD